MRIIATLVMMLGLAAPWARAESPVVDVPKESARTAGHAVRDGTLAVGRTVRDFFTGGPRKAKQTWKENAARTRADAHADKERVKAAAHE
jgi:hypothetical protein